MPSIPDTPTKLFLDEDPKIKIYLGTLIRKGWSPDQKYYTEAADGQKLLIRIADYSKYERKKEEFSIMQLAAATGIPMSQAIRFGTCDHGQRVYSLLSWVDGQDAEELLPTLSLEKQYEFGWKAGEILAKIHSIPAPKTQEEWGPRFNQKITDKIQSYRKCGIKVDDEDKILEYIEQNKALLANRPQTLRHGDYHAGNMIISSEETLSVIDWNRFDYGDPWQEFDRIVWCAVISPYFATGRINGYFGEKPPIEFFRLLAFYIAVNALGSVPWAIPFGKTEIDTMLRQAKNVIHWFDGMANPVPTWYKNECSYKPKNNTHISPD